MALSAVFKSSAHISWKSTSKFQKTISKCIEKCGVSLHSGKLTIVKLWPELAGKGRYFDVCSNLIRASIDFVEESPLCTTVCESGFKVRTVEHLLSALEATGVDNCRIEVVPTDCDDRIFEVPILDGSAREWVEMIEQTGLEDAKDHNGNICEKMVPVLIDPVHVQRNDSFVAAFPSPNVQITYGINFPEVPHIGCQWFSSAPLECSFYPTDIAPSRTFCIFEEVEKLHNAGLIKGGSTENAVVCSASKGWLNPPLHFPNEPCRHKVLDLIGDLSMFARCGSQGVPVAHIVAYKAGHALHAEFVRCLSKSSVKN
ncbi:hypothetical protein Nepgr_016986 [Nepenthes gracilis]|uniref:UDP-3-O-acyl-N-acetylglucosamine deacetylase n=1 Tax=Nepenthes gracilis TaxID=150966 RepID=A0AAD3SQS1_NEPGR|nr:hypothetical protein Nepgr_016986 [Nepenthes gracilis]